MRWAFLLITLLVGCGDASNTQYLPIGSRCSSSGQCGTSPFECATTNLPNGYCSKSCTTDGDCPPDSLCNPTPHACRRRCKVSADCRLAEGYSCVDLLGGNSVCEFVGAMDGGAP